MVPSAGAAEELRHTAGLFLLFAPIIYLAIGRRTEAWERKHPYTRFSVFVLTFLVACVVLVTLAVLLVGTGGLLAELGSLLATVVAFGAAVWMTFYGGAERAWEAFLARTEFRW